MSGILEDTILEAGRLVMAQGGSFKNITTTTNGSATLSLVKSGAGFLHAIIVNTTANGAITIYDNTAQSGTKIGTLKASVAEGTYQYDVKFSNGLTVVTATNPNITISYR